MGTLQNIDSQFGNAGVHLDMVSSVKFLLITILETKDICIALSMFNQLSVNTHSWDQMLRLG